MVSPWKSVRNTGQSVRHVGHPDVTARLFRQAGQVLRRGLPSARQRGGAAENRPRVGRGDDLRDGIAGSAVAQIEHKRPIEAIRAAAQNDPASDIRLDRP